MNQSMASDTTSARVVTDVMTGNISSSKFSSDDVIAPARWSAFSDIWIVLAAFAILVSMFVSVRYVSRRCWTNQRLAVTYERRVSRPMFNIGGDDYDDTAGSLHSNHLGQADFGLTQDKVLNHLLSDNNKLIHSSTPVSSQALRRTSSAHGRLFREQLASETTSSSSQRAYKPSVDFTTNFKVPISEIHEANNKSIENRDKNKRMAASGTRSNDTHKREFSKPDLSHAVQNQPIKLNVQSALATRRREGRRRRSEQLRRISKSEAQQLPSVLEHGIDTEAQTGCVVMGTTTADDFGRQDRLNHWRSHSEYHRSSRNKVSVENHQAEISGDAIHQNNQQQEEPVTKPLSTCVNDVDSLPIPYMDT
jgi:hypothetical protein